MWFPGIFLWFQGIVVWISVVPGSGCAVPGSGCAVPGSGCAVPHGAGAGCQVKDLRGKLRETMRGAATRRTLPGKLEQAPQALPVVQAETGTGGDPAPGRTRTHGKTTD